MNYWFWWWVYWELNPNRIYWRVQILICVSITLNVITRATAGSGTKRQAQAPAGTCLSRLSRHRLRHQPAWTGPDRLNRLMSAHTGYGRLRPAQYRPRLAQTSPDSKILFLYQHLYSGVSVFVPSPWPSRDRSVHVPSPSRHRPVPRRSKSSNVHKRS